jgi:GDP-4-dehydro-6-deoxy-D-mannose reductase
MNVLITGALGFGGRNLNKVLNKKGLFKLFASDFHRDEGTANYYHCDILDLESVNVLLLKTKPDFICHLAGSFSNEYEKDYATNVLATKNVLEAVRNIRKKCRVMLFGSAAEYGVVAKAENPIKESRVLRPVSVYGLTKVYQTALMQYYLNALNLDIVMARPFNIFGRGISNKLFVGRVYEQIQLLKNNEIQKIVLGNLDNERDYISIDDATEHYISIMLYGKKGEIYNVGNGVPLQTRTLLKKILKEENVDESLVETTNLKRDNIYDVSQIYADISKLKGLSKNE